MADALGARRTSRLSCVRRVRIGRCGPVEFELERETGEPEAASVQTERLYSRAAH
jgi:hypothetical protein